MDDREGSKRKIPRWRNLIPRSGERRSLLISMVLLAFLMFMLLAEYAPRAARFDVGKPSPETVVASREFTLIDEETTEEERESERQRVAALFIDPNARSAAVSDLSSVFDQAKQLADAEGSLEDKASDLRERAGAELDYPTIKLLLTSSDERSRVLYKAAMELLTASMAGPVAMDNVDSVKGEIYSRAEGLDIDDELRVPAADLAASLLQINTAYSAETVEHDMEVAAAAVPPSYIKVEAGQKIVEKGDIITPLTLTLLEEAGALSPAGTYQHVIGIGLLLLAIYAASVYFFHRYRPEIAANYRVVTMVCLVFLSFSLLCRLFSVFADDNVIWGYLVPLALVGLTYSILLDKSVSLFMVIVGGVITGMILKGNFYLTITALIGGLLGAVMISEARTRERLVRAGAELSLALAVVSMITASLFRELDFILVAGAFGLGNGALSTLLTLGSLPVLERISDITTPMRLLELVSPDQPLMKELITKAPGTYSHSVIVGNLADAAAREIGADALLARVGSYYHDIGKIKRSTFFVENQPEGINGHEKLKPNLSALVITAHVKEGVDMAREYHLPSEITDIIRQHHGTSLIRYFYARALQEGNRVENVSESRFRYPGKKPQSKEAAIVMLADAIEAAAKSMEKPSPVKLDQLTRALIRERLEDGQLSDSKLTLGDLDKIAKAFTRILNGMYHVRVEYPALVKEGELP